MTGVAIIGHFEDIRLLDLPVVTKPGDLQVWRNNDNCRFQSHQFETFIRCSL